MGLFSGHHLGYHLRHEPAVWRARHQQGLGCQLVAVLPLWCGHLVDVGLYADCKEADPHHLEAVWTDDDSWCFVHGVQSHLFEAYKYIPSGIATSILYVYPIMVALIMMFFGQFPSWKTWISIFAGVAGAILLSLKGGGGFIDWRGIALVVASGLCYTLFIVIVNQSKQVKAIPSLTLTFYCFLIGSVMLFALSGFGVHLNAVPDAVSWLNVLGLAVLPTAIATITLAAATKTVGATKTSILGILEPLTAIVIGTLVFHEAFTLNVALGVALILFAILFMILTDKKA